LTPSPLELASLALKHQHKVSDAKNKKRIKYGYLSRR
jgi:hypothetical protein